MCKQLYLSSHDFKLASTQFCVEMRAPKSLSWKSILTDDWSVKLNIITNPCVGQWIIDSVTKSSMSFTKDKLCTSKWIGNNAVFVIYTKHVLATVEMACKEWHPILKIVKRHKVRLIKFNSYLGKLWALRRIIWKIRETQAHDLVLGWKWLSFFGLWIPKQTRISFLGSQQTIN